MKSSVLLEKTIEWDHRMTTVKDRTMTLTAGIAVGVFAMITIAEFTDEGENGGENLNIKRNEMVADRQVASYGDEEKIQVEATLTCPPHSQDVARQESEGSPIGLPDVYAGLIQERQERKRIMFEDIHQIFKNETRNEAWAGAMESGINHYLTNTKYGEWGVVEYVECRSKMCEIAGYSDNGGENHARSMIEEFLGSGLWQGTSITHSTSFHGTDPSRFVIILSGYSHIEYPSILSAR